MLEDNRMNGMNDVELDPDSLSAVSGGAAGASESGSGFFQSDSGTGLNIRADWRVTTDAAGGKTLHVEVSSVSYSLYSAALANGVELYVNGAVYLADSSPVSYGGKAQTRNTLATYSIPNLSGLYTVCVVWRFNGSYSNVKLTELRATGTVSV